MGCLCNLYAPRTDFQKDLLRVCKTDKLGGHRRRNKVFRAPEVHDGCGGSDYTVKRMIPAAHGRVAGMTRRDIAP